jgi:hypothetical protein
VTICVFCTKTLAAGDKGWLLSQHTGAMLDDEGGLSESRIEPSAVQDSRSFLGHNPSRALSVLVE